MPAWTPGDLWPGSAGGAWSPHWGGHVTLFVRAALAAGHPFTLGGGAPTPPGPTYALHLDATDTSTITYGTTPPQVLYWYDKSAAARRFQLAVPPPGADVQWFASAINGHPAVRTAGSFHEMTAGNVDPQTLFDPVNHTDQMWFAVVMANNATRFSLMRNSSTVAGQRFSVDLRTATVYDAGNTTTARLSGTTSFAITTPYLYAGYRNGATVKLYRNGVQLLSRTDASGAVSSSPTGNLNIFMDSAYRADTGEIRVVPAYDPAQFTSIHAELATKWGITVTPVVDDTAAARSAATPYDRLDAGNVLAGGEAVGRDGDIDRLWVDLSCDVVDLEIAGGASSSQGVLSKADAGTAVITLADPTGKYDPLNGESPFAYGGRSRLVPGTPVEVFAEVVDPATSAITERPLFTGTADSWGENWTPRPTKREAKLVATDETKVWARFNRPETAPVGAGDTTRQRVERLAAYYDWLGTLDQPATGTATLQATTLAQQGWELLNRTLDDELGYVHFTPAGVLRWVNRDAWFTVGPPVIALGCQHVDSDARDVLVEAHPNTVDQQMRNTIFAARDGGTVQTAQSTSSVDRYGPYDYKRTDLGLADDGQAATWAETLLLLYAFPQYTLEDVTFLPAVDPQSWEVWNQALAVDLVTDIVRVVWAPPDLPDNVVDGLARVVGYRHTITRRQWEVRWQLVAADALGTSGQIFTLGPHAQDRLDAGFVLALA